MYVTKVVKSLRRRLTRNPRKLAVLHREQGVNMGSGCVIYGGVGFGSEPYLVHLGDNVKVTAGVQFVTHDGGMHVLRQFPELVEADLFGDIRVGSNVFIGIRTIVMPGVRIGDNVVIGAGSIITRDIPANSVAAGVPCRVIRSIEDYRNAVTQRVDMTKGWPAAQKRAFLTEKFSQIRDA